MSDEEEAAWVALSQVGRDLVALAGNGELPASDLRDAEAQALLAELDQGRSVLLVGADGVGRTTVLRAAARAMAEREHGAIFEMSTTSLLSGTKYLGEWQTKVTEIFDLAADHGFCVCLTDLVALPFAGAATNNPSNMLDALRPYIASKRVAVIGEASPAVLRQMERTPGFAELFTKIAVEPMAPEAVDQVLGLAASRMGLDLDAKGRATLVDLTRRFLPARPQPAPALDLLSRVHDYQGQKAGIDEHEAASPEFIERVFSIYSGLPRFVVSRSQTRSATEIRQWFDDRIIGQREAIDAVVQSIALFKAGLNDPRRPLGTFLFVGPTGVGKTELARAMAAFLFGSATRVLRFDLGEYKDFHSFERLLGSASRPDEPALLVDALRNQPFQVVLFDELEKAHPNVMDVLLGLLDEGRATSPRGETVDLRSAFVICTSNAGAQEAAKAVGFGAQTDPGGRRERLLGALEATFRPELLARFQHIVPFHPLDRDMVRSIARQHLRELLQRDGITSRNLAVEVDDAAIDVVVERGFDPRWGARGLERELQRRIALPLAMTLMEHRVDEGQLLKVTGANGQVHVRRLDTETSREARKEAEPIQFGGRTWSRDDLAQAHAGLRKDLEALVLGVDEPAVVARQAELLAQREDPAFWVDSDTASRALRDLDHLTRTLDRIDRLRTRLSDFETDLARTDSRRRLAGMARRMEGLREAMAVAWRELLFMGQDGVWDALVEVRPLQGGRMGRDVIVRLYTAWAEGQQFEVDWLHDPRLDDEAAMFAVKGRYAYGLLKLESGVHRLREGEASCTVRVNVAPWTDQGGLAVFTDHRALKAIGAYGGKIRSRLACEGGLVLQNARTLAENRDLAVELVAAWADAPGPVDAIVRRYDLVAPLVRDVLTGESSGRPDALSPPRFHDLLCRRVDRFGEGPDAA